MYINYDPNQGISISTFHQPEGYYNSDVSGLIDDMVAGKPGCCPLKGSLDALQDGSIWPNSDAAQSALEELHSAIIAHMRQNGQHEEADSYFS